VVGPASSNDVQLRIALPIFKPGQLQMSSDLLFNGKEAARR
jgi:hypothetical protein